MNYSENRRNYRGVWRGDGVNPPDASLNPPEKVPPPWKVENFQPPQVE